LIALIVVVLVLVFFAAGRATRAFHAEERDLAETWFHRGEADLKSHQPGRAIDAYRSALGYSPGNALFELRLAEALVSGKRTAEARSYLLALWERDPQSGPVNYELARLSAEDGNVGDVIRYYHNAIYGEWDSPDENRRRTLRMEVYRTLRARGASEQAEAELMALSGEAPHDATAHVEIGELLLRDGDDDHALKEFQAASAINPRIESALAGAGAALFQMGRTAEAQHFLHRAVAVNPRDAQARALAETAGFVLALDPFDPLLRNQEKSRRAARAFEAATERLRDCTDEFAARPAATPVEAPAGDELLKLKTEGRKLARQASPPALARNPDSIVTVMDFVFRAEAAATKACGPATGADRALEVIGERHGGAS
jgi:tetratricopeptide (TPR) repeat protein